MGGITMIGALDHLQTQPIDGIPFLLAHSIIICIKVVSLNILFVYLAMNLSNSNQ